MNRTGQKVMRLGERGERRRRVRARAWPAGLLMTGTLLLGGGAVAWSGGASGATADGPHTSAVAAATAQSSTESLAGVCPSTIQMVMNWTPEAEQGAYYELAASGGDINTSTKSYTANLVDQGHKTGVKIEIISGGPAIGYLQPPEYLYTHPSVLLALGSTDQSIIDYSRTPTEQIVAPFRINPQVLMWNPSKYHITNLSQVPATHATVLYFNGSAYMTYLMGAGYVSSAQADGSDKGNPDRWVASGGTIIQQGYATEEPYLYSHELPAWDTAIAYDLIANTGYDAYDAIETRPSDVSQYAKCFTKLVPMIQRAQISYVEHPSRVNHLIVTLIQKYGVGGPYDLAEASYTARTELRDRIVSQPTSGGFGSFSLKRVTHLLNVLRPIEAKNSNPLPSSLTAQKVVTNRFIDPTVTLPYNGPYNKSHGVVVVDGKKK